LTSFNRFTRTSFRPPTVCSFSFERAHPNGYPLPKLRMRQDRQHNKVSNFARWVTAFFARQGVASCLERAALDANAGAFAAADEVTRSPRYRPQSWGMCLHLDDYHKFSKNTPTPYTIGR
jgi:hypothetical protein